LPFFTAVSVTFVYFLPHSSSAEILASGIRLGPLTLIITSPTLFSARKQAGLLNPLSLLSPAAAAGGDTSLEQNGAALLAMLQGAAPTAAPVAAQAPTAAPSAAVAGGGVAGTPAKKPPKGVTLARGEAAYEVGAVGANARKQTKVTAITIYNTDPGPLPCPQSV